MVDRRSRDPLRDLVDEIEERLRDAERLRNHAEQRRHQEAFWPDRRHTSRVPDRGDSKIDRDRRSH